MLFELFQRASSFQLASQATLLNGRKFQVIPTGKLIFPSEAATHASDNLWI